MLGFEFDNLDSSEQPQQKLMHIGLNILRMLQTKTEMTIYRLVVAEAERCPGLAEAFYRECTAPVFAHLTEHFKRAALEGQLDVQDTDFAAEELFALLHTNICMKRRLGLTDTPSGKEQDYGVQQAVVMLLNRYGTEKKTPREEMLIASAV